MSYRTEAWFYFGVGIALVGFGGLAMNYGWHRYSAHWRKKAFVAGLAREWVHTRHLFVNRPFSHVLTREPLPSPQGEPPRTLYTPFPRLSTACATAIITSELFQPENCPREKELVGALLDLQANTQRLNEMLGWVDADIARQSVTERLVADTYRNVSRSPLLSMAVDGHEGLGKLLLRNYRWSLPPDHRKALEAEAARRGSGRSEGSAVSSSPTPGATEPTPRAPLDDQPDR